MKNIFLYLILPLAIASFLVSSVRLIDKSNSNTVVTSNTATDKIIFVDYQNPHGKDLGIGPIKKVDLGPINAKMVGEGKSLFNTKCSVCHEMSQKKIGPPLGGITKQRTPEFIMNLLLNTVEMQKNDPVIKGLIKEYNNLPMPNPSLTQKQARSVLEYLRSVNK